MYHNRSHNSVPQQQASEWEEEDSPRHSHHHHPQQHAPVPSRSDPSYNTPPTPDLFPGFGQTHTPQLPSRQHSTPGRPDQMFLQQQRAIPVYAARVQLPTSPFAATVPDNTFYRHHSDAYEEDEPSDVLVWNSTTTTAHRHHNHRSHSDMEEHRDRDHFHPPSGSITLSNRNLSKSRSVKSLNNAKSQESNGNLTAEDYEGHLAAVTKQLESIRTTQDSILAELSDDISNLQFENVQLKNTNEHLTMQNSHLLQVISDLSNEVEQMREVFRIRGWSTHQLKSSPDAQPQQNNAKIDSYKSQEAQDQDKKALLDAEATINPTRDRHKRRHRSRPSELNEKFENVPLDNPNPNSHKNDGKQSSWPGDDQVAALSQNNHQPHPTTTEPLKQRRSSKHSRRDRDSMSVNANTTNTNTTTTKRPSTNPRQSNNSSMEKMRPERDDDTYSQSCFKNLFKRNKKRQSHSTRARLASPTGGSDDLSLASNK